MSAQPAYSNAQKREALAVVLSTASLEAARELLTSLWGGESAPSKGSLSNWSRDSTLTPDGDLLNALERERKSTLFGRLHRLHEAVGERFLREIEEMSWTDIQKGAIGIGIFTDKLLGTAKGAQATINVNDNRGQDRRSVSYTFGPKDEIQA